MLLTSKGTALSGLTGIVSLKYVNLEKYICKKMYVAECLSKHMVEEYLPKHKHKHNYCSNEFTCISKKIDLSTICG